MNSKPKVALIDYGAGNQTSVLKAFEYIGADVNILKNPQSMRDYSHIVLPGVGSFYRSINLIRKLNWDECILNLAKEGKPLLGICLGMQLLFTKGTEDGDSLGLDLIPGEVNHFSLNANLKGLRLPHVGFDSVYINNESLLFKNLPSNLDFYFTHSYTANCKDSFIISKTVHGKKFASAVENGNVLGTQFHPEKSQINGLNLLKNFLNYY